MLFNLNFSIAQNAFDTLEVSTTRIPLKINETGRNITVINSEDLQKMSFTSLDDLMQFIPGIEVQSRNAFGAQGDISMRGSTYTQVLVLIDGMKLNDPLTAHFNSNIPVTPAEIERIEVLRGAAAAMYGADAVGGVINIITKGFANKKQNGRAVQGTINYGQNKLINAEQGFSVQKDRLYVGGGFSINQSDGQFVEGDTTIGIDGYNNYFDIKTIGTSFAYQLDGGWAIRTRTAYDYRDFSARYFYTTSTFDKSTEITRNWWNQLQIEKVGNSSSTDLNVSYKYNTDQFVFSPDFPSTNNHITQFWNFQLNHFQSINDQLSLKFGAQVDKRSIESNDRGNHQDWHQGLYAMGIFRPNSQLNLTASLRIDNDQNYNTEISPQLNISYVLPKVVLRGSVGRSIRAADYTERYVSFNLKNLTPGRSLGNPDLIAERSWSEEIGADFSITSNWQMKATVFARQSSNLIDYVSTNENDIPNNANLRDSANYFFATNITDVQTIGFELESWFSHKVGDARILWSLGYTYLNTTNDTDVISVYISSHARHLVTTNLVAKVADFEASLNGVYKKRNEQAATSINANLASSYTVFNLRLSYNFAKNIGANIQIHNLGNTNYQNILGAQMPNRWIMGGLKFNF